MDIEGSLPLTPREGEIASLAARGLSNREIAEWLVVSVRTVDNQLRSAYVKLGIGGRGELSVILEPFSGSAPKARRRVGPRSSGEPNTLRRRLE